MYACVVLEEAFAQRLAAALDAALYYRAMNRRELAERIDVSAETVGRWLRGEHVMSVADAAKIAEALDAPAELFLRPPETRAQALALIAAWEAR